MRPPLTRARRGSCSETYVSLYRVVRDERSVGFETAPSPKGTNMNSPGSHGGWVTVVTRRATLGGRQPGGTDPEGVEQ